MRRRRRRRRCGGRRKGWRRKVFLAYYDFIFTTIFIKIFIMKRCRGWWGDNEEEGESYLIFQTMNIIKSVNFWNLVGMYHFINLFKTNVIISYLILRRGVRTRDWRSKERVELFHFTWCRRCRALHYFAVCG